MKALFLDIETAPNTAYIWSLWKEPRSTNCLVKDWYIMCWCAKWLNEKKMYTASIHESSTYKKDPSNDKEVLLALRDLLNEADVVIAHNGVRFDCKKIRTRFLLNNINPPSPFKVIDTLKAARKYFAFTSNRLDDLGQFLKVGKKLKTDGFKLWKDCLKGKKSAWKKMIRYNKKDVKLLEKVYYKLLPYMDSHPSYGVYVDEERPHCPKCGHHKIIYQGYAYTRAGKYRKFQCKKCGAWGRRRNNLLPKTKRVNITTNIH